MDNRSILEHVHRLAEEEHSLREASSEAGERLAKIEEEFDHCWDLLRQPRAKGESGDDPEQVKPQAHAVEHYIG